MIDSKVIVLLLEFLEVTWKFAQSFDIDPLVGLSYLDIAVTAVFIVSVCVKTLGLIAVFFGGIWVVFVGLIFGSLCR